jgi:hypothetical protein
MTMFETLREHGKPAFFHLLIAGSNDVAVGTRQEAEKIASITKIAVAASIDTLPNAYKEKDLKTSKWESCLIVALFISPEIEWTDFLAHLKGFRFRGQCLFYIVAEDKIRLDLETMVALSNNHVFKVADAQTFLEELGRMTAESEDFPNFRWPFKKKPGEWIRGFKHDYLANFVSTHRNELVNAGVWVTQKRVDEIQFLLRNLLVFPYEARPERFFQDEPLANTGRVAIAEELVPMFRGMQKPDWTVLQRVQNLAHCEGNNQLFLLPTEWREECSESLSGKSSTVWIGDSALEMTWLEWQQAFSNGLFSSLSQAQLSEVEDWLSFKIDIWRATAGHTVATLFEDLGNCLATTQKHAGSLLDDDYRLTIPRAWLAVKHAQYQFTLGSL